MKGQMSLERATSFSLAAHLVFILIAALITSIGASMDNTVYTVRIISPEPPAPERAREEPRAPQHRQKVPPPKKVPPKDNEWLSERPEPEKKVPAYRQERDAKERRIREMREIKEAERYKQERLEELKEQARLDSIRQRATTAGRESSPMSETERSRLLEDYGERIQAIIYGNWVYTLADEDRDLVTKISVTVLRDGTLNINRVAEPSGDRAFDQSALRAIRKTGKVEPPPFGRDEEVILNFYPE